MSKKSLLIWRFVQVAVWLVGITILFYLFYSPIIGIHLFWNILIPVAPLVVVVAISIWRNVCPLASTALFPNHIGVSKKKILSQKQIEKLNLLGIILLFVIVPLRHIFFNLNGYSTGIMLISFGLLAILLGLRYNWKSAWCSGLCPVHPVEKLYGLNNKLFVPNAHCDSCHKCVSPCPDSTKKASYLAKEKSTYHKITYFIMVALFPGFVWGWFQVEDMNGITEISQLLYVYSFPFYGMVANAILFLILKSFIDNSLLVKIFAVLAVSFYYWYRIPALFGFGMFPEDGMLIDLTDVLSEPHILSVKILFTVFFFWWIILRKESKYPWNARPRFFKHKTLQMS